MAVIVPYLALNASPGIGCAERLLLKGHDRRRARISAFGETEKTAQGKNLQPLHCSLMGPNDDHRLVALGIVLLVQSIEPRENTRIHAWSQLRDVNARLDIGPGVTTDDQIHPIVVLTVRIKIFVQMDQQTIVDDFDVKCSTRSKGSHALIITPFPGWSSANISGAKQTTILGCTHWVAHSRPWPGPAHRQAMLSLSTAQEPTMRHAVLTAIKEPLSVVTTEDPQPANGEVVVRIHAAALNHRDVWITMGQYAGISCPCTPGSDGAGVVETCGPGVDPSWVGREVVINPAFDWGPNPATQSPGFTILGLPRQGTHATHIAVPVTQVSAKPGHLDWHQAAALPLAGLTAWRALTVKGRPRPTDTVLITGIGGGVALFALQIAKAMGLRTIVTSSSAEKRERARTLGAEVAYDYREDGWWKKLKQEGGFDVAIDGAGGAGLAHLVEAARPGARIAIYGGTAGLPEAINIRAVFFKQLQILGTTMGSPQDFAEWMRFVDRHQLKPVLDQRFALDDIQAAYKRMADGGQFGKITLGCE
jgi:zinc-binding alcohol dehydrogenase/oxidoreductase